MSATGRGTIRNERDFYPTPETAFLPFLRLMKQGTIFHNLAFWEPAMGDGRLVTMMRNNGMSCYGDDIANGRDFLTDFTPRHAIITNPPYSLAMEFVRHSIRVSAHVFLLLRINFLGSQKRKEWWQLNEPSALVVLSTRPSFTGKGTDATEYAWFCWSNLIRGIWHV